MEIVLTCGECSYQERSLSEKGLMNKIIMWNHVKKMHPSMAQRIMRMHTTVPNHLYTARPTAGTSVIFDFEIQ